MAEESISIAVRLDGRTFLRFALFDTFVRHRRWVRPALFSAIFLAFSAVSFARSRDQAALLGATLAAVGLGLPAVYFGMYLASVRREVKSLKLDARGAVYELTFTGAPDGVAVRGAGGAARYEWGKLSGAWRARGCVYLYVAPNRAFLLPDGQATAEPAALWAFLVTQLPLGRAHGRPPQPSARSAGHI